MPRRLTPRSTLDNLKKEAKRWLRAIRDNVADARVRLDRASPGTPAVPTLRDIQHALAREYGFSGWTVLKKSLAHRAANDRLPDDLVNRFLENACPDHHVRGGPAHVRARYTAIRLLERYPEIAPASLATEIVCGDLAAVEAALAAHPEIASAKVSGPSAERSKPGGGGRWLQRDMDRDLGAKGWEPLLYLCFTRLPLAAAVDNAMPIARMLLDYGADPNAFFMAGDSRYTPLVGAIGEGEEDRPAHPHRDALVRLLLDRGAEPYDIQVIYNIHFHGEVLWFLELIYERSVQLGRGADWDDPEWKMLDMGGYGNGARWHLWVAIQHNDIRLAEWCLAHGASPDPAPPRPKTPPQRSMYEEAVRRGCTEIAALLVQHGASRVAVALESIEVFSAAVFRLDRDAAQWELTRRPELIRDPRPMLEAARRDRVDVIELLLELGISPDVANGENEHPLHAAAYANAVRAAELLIARGAEVDPVESNWNNTPLAAAIYAQHLPMIELLGRYSRDTWELVYSGQLERVRELLAENPALARLAGGGHTLLMWLPPQDEQLALEIAQLLLLHGADASSRNNDGQTAADRAAAQGMFELAALLREAQTPDGTRPTVEGFERMAENLLAAYRTGIPEAMERHYADTWHRRAWPAMRRYTLLDLGRVPGQDDEYIDISLDDARQIVAREHRFDNWNALVDFVTHLPPGKRRIIARPVELGSVAFDQDDHPRQLSRDWDEAADLIAARHFSVLNAHGQMTDDAMQRISHLADLTALRLNGSKALTDAGVRHLSRMPQLRHLDLSGTQVTDRGLESLRDLPNLQTISLPWTAITDAGIASLAQCQHLTRVDLSGTATGDGAIKVLAGKAALRTFSTGNGVTDAGVTQLHAFPVFKSWQESGAPAPSADMDGGPNSLMLRGAITDRGLTALVGLDGLFGLNIWDINLAITAAGLAPLARLPNLGRLAVEAHDETMPYIARMPHLRFLMIQDTDAGDDGWMALSQSQSIEQIWGRRCYNLRSRGFRALANMSALENLAVSCKSVDDDAIATLPAFPALREIMPMDIPDEGYRHIARCERLERLILMYCRDTTDRATEHITGMRHLKRYFASYTQITDITPELLSGMVSLEDLEFSACAGLTNAGIAALARLTRLRRLGLGGMPRVTREVIGLFRPGVKVRHSG
jgi:ankyrin repeat protein/Leucine-rich repeat (LRR) protein